MTEMFLTEEQLAKKWQPILEHADLPKITDPYKRRVTQVLLENQERALKDERNLMEAVPNSNTTNVSNYDPVLIGLVRRAMPQLIAYDICGVQPMTMPTGLVFALKSTYTDKNGAEALFNEADAGFSGKATAQAGTSPVESTNGLNPWDGSPGFTGVSNGRGPLDGTAGTDPQNWGASDGATMNQMSFTITKNTVTATSRALKAEYTVELAQDLKAVHGLDAEGELSNILSSEIIAEINREVVRAIYKTAKVGAELTTTAGTFDLDIDANGRWSVERFKGLMFQIEREANRIAQTTRRGRGNFLLCSADVASALALAGQLVPPGPQISTNLNVDESSTTYAGMLNGKYKVYIDPYMANGSADQFCLVGYRGSSPFDAGIFYCPYVPLQLMRAVDPATFQPKIGFKTRYGLTNHPLSGSTAVGSDGAPTFPAASNFYFRLFKVANLA
jgi:hypothetical protein